MTNWIRESLKANNCFLLQKSYISREFKTWQMHGLAYTVFTKYHPQMQMVSSEWTGWGAKPMTVCSIFLVRITAVYNLNWANWNF